MKFWGIFRFTFGETIRQGVLLFYAGISTIILLILSLVISNGPDGPMVLGHLLPQQPDAPFAIAQGFIYGVYSQSVFWILLFGIFGTAGLIPSMLEKGTAELFLSKPMNRAWLLFGRTAGASAAIGVNILYVLTGTFVLFGLRWGFWHPPLFLSALLLVLIFFIYYSVVALIGLISRNTAVTIMASLVYFPVSWALESREAGLYRLWNNEIVHRVIDGLYYLLPQVGGMLGGSSLVVGGLAVRVASHDFPYAAFLWSAGSAALIYLYALWTFSRSDY